MTWLLIILAVYGTLLLFFWVAQDGLVFPRKLTGPVLPVRPPAGGEQVWIEADGVRIEGWYFPPPEAGEARPAVLYAHGNAMLVDHCLEFAQMYGEMGLGVLLVEYRGYGISGGSPSQRAIVSDFTRFREWLEERPEVGEVIYHGRSLGGAVVAQLARKHQPAAMILESTFTSVRSFTGRYLIPPILLRHPFDTKMAIGEVSAPILILHGESDQIVPMSQGRRLHEAAPASIFVSMPGGHNDFPGDFGVYKEAIRGFLADQGLLPP